MNEHFFEPKRRETPAAMTALRSERKLMLPFRKDIGQLQLRVTFVVAKAARSPAALEELSSELEELKRQVAAVRARIYYLMHGDFGVGPAADCRSALAQLASRLSSSCN